MTTNNQYQSNLSQLQIETLSEYIFEKHGYELSDEELIESIFLVLEDIPGFENDLNKSTQYLITQIRNLYYGK